MENLVDTVDNLINFVETLWKNSQQFIGRKGKSAMHYDEIEPAVFLERPNRFTAVVETARGREVCHVKNTGRCKELLIPGAEIYVQRNHKAGRKTQLDLITVRKGDHLINMDSQVPNYVAAEWVLKSGFVSPEADVKLEKTYGNSRFDLYIEDGARRIFMEVKGVTLGHAQGAGKAGNQTSEGTDGGPGGRI